MTIRDLKWSAREKKIARAVFDKAYDREMQRIQEAVSEKARNIKEGDDVWRLHDYIAQKRREVRAKYDYRYSVLIFVFARLFREGLISDEDLEGLSQDKVETIHRISET